MNEIKCSFCKKNNKFENAKIDNNKKMKTIYCSNCGRAIIAEFNDKKYYKVVD